MSDRISEIEKRISLKKEKILSTLEPKQHNSESVAANNLGLTAEEKISLTVEMLNLAKSSCQFDRDKSSAINYFLNPARKEQAENFGWNLPSKEGILHQANIDAQKKEILRNEGIAADDNQYHYPFPELFPEESTDAEIKVARLHRSVIAEELENRHSGKPETIQDIVKNRIVKESQKPVKCFKTMSELYILKSIIADEQKQFNQEIADLLNELYD